MRLSKNMYLIIRLYGLVLSVFFVFRLLLFAIEINRIDWDIDGLDTIISAFIMGLRFDIVITSYILIIPSLLLILMDVFQYEISWIRQFCFYWIYLLFLMAFAISSADIPYFVHFFSRFSVGAFEWMENPSIVFGMIFQEIKFVIYFIPFLILVWLFYKLLHKFFSKEIIPSRSNVLSRISLSIIFLAFMFLGIRGRATIKSPIRVGTAYISNSSFLNQLGLNPVFTLLRSYLDSRKKENQTINLMDETLAIKMVQEQLGIVPSTNASPLARKIRFDTLTNNKPNVVIIIMESMSAAKMKRHGNTNNLTPFLDSLSDASYYFENIYTAGKHTFNGIFSTLFSLPALYRKHPMKKIRKFNGISSVLRAHDYATCFFTTHDGQFDNVEGFLRANEFEQVISQSDYPRKEIKTSLGVPDDFMFEFSIPIIDELYNKGKPFFTAFMTVSDHAPYYIPPYFEPKTFGIKNQIVEYADWSLKKFINLASTKPWFDNTIFVFIADHGSPISATYDISLDYHHSPLIFYAPKLLSEEQIFKQIGGQIDVFPTLMEILELPYTNTTLGINLLDEKRDYILINDDDKIGVLDNEFLLIIKDNSDLKLYKYQNKDRTNYASEYPEKTIEMSNYVKSNLQVYQYLLNQQDF